LQCFSQFLDGVEAAHLKNVVHRDLKPENILVLRKEDRLVIADFGIAQFRQDELWTAVETQATDRLANFQYAAPEQRTRGGEVDHRADIYALGLILNEMFTGQVIQGTGYKTIASVSPDNAFLDDLVAEMIRQAAAERATSIEAVKKALIGRKKDFVIRQQLSALKDTVIPVTDVDDPLVIDPPRLVDVDWNRDQLTLTLSQPVNAQWVWVIQNEIGGPFMLGYEAENFTFHGNNAMIEADERVARQVVDHFKAWLPMANKAYEQLVRKQKAEHERQARKALEAQIEEKERRAHVLRYIRI
jgi:serine/threonine protein kinase